MAGIGEDLDARQMVLSKEIATDVVCSGARILRTPKELSRTGRDSTTPQYGNTIVAAARLNPPIMICHSTNDSPSRNRNQDIINPIGPFSIQWIRNAKKIKTSIDDFFAEDRGIKPIFSKVVGCKFAENCSVDITSHCGINFGSNTVFT